MPSPNEKLAESLDVLEALQQGNRRVFRSDDLSRVHRERLMENGFLQEVMKGWLISSSPDSEPGESTPWHASFWEFCARYCDERFGEQWHLSPEQSLFLRSEEHTSELQSRLHLVCRLLLEKKKRIRLSAKSEEMDLPISPAASPRLPT